MANETMVFITRGDSIKPEQFMQVIEELRGGSDRAAAIVGAALVELQLEGALLAQLHKHPKVTDVLFHPSQALGAFVTKIHLGLLIGLYGEAAHNELLIIKDIRNKFAHSLEVRDFKKHQQIADKAMNLTFGDRYTFDPGAGKPPARVDLKGKPIGEWPWWFGANNRDAKLKDPRERFLLSVQALVYALAAAEQPMPTPKF